MHVLGVHQKAARGLLAGWCSKMAVHHGHREKHSLHHVDDLDACPLVLLLQVTQLDDLVMDGLEHIGHVEHPLLDFVDVTHSLRTRQHFHTILGLRAAR